MKAITTKYHGPGNVRGSKVSANDSDGNRVIVHYCDNLSSLENHQKAAAALCKKMGWHGELCTGGIKGGYVHVFLDHTETFKV